MSRQVRTDHGYRVYASRRDVRFTEMEYAVPREHGAEAVRRVIELVRRRRLPVHVPDRGARRSAPDDAFLSTAAGRDTVYVAVHQYRGMEFETYFRAVEAIMDDYGGRPHWGKRHYRSAAELAALYPDWDRFHAVRDRLDPGRLFANDYTDRVLGPDACGSPEPASDYRPQREQAAADGAGDREQHARPRRPPRRGAEDQHRGRRARARPERQLRERDLGDQHRGGVEHGHVDAHRVQHQPVARDLGERRHEDQPGRRSARCR